MSTLLLRATLAAAWIASFAPAAPPQAPTLYRLDGPSAYEFGCQAPCLCPIALTDDLFGTLTLVFDHSDPQGFDHYAVRDVNWVLGRNPLDVRVHGNGTYRIGGPLAQQQQLELDLALDEDAPRHFDSGLVPGGSLATLAVDVALNGFFCFDEVFRLVATPVPASEPVTYRLRRSLYAEGCYDPCACPIAQWRAIGTFDLVDLGPGSDPLRQRYAVVDADWRTVSAGSPPDRSWTGTGIYVLELATAEHRLMLDFVDQDGNAQAFDSGRVHDPAVFPRISIPVSQNGFYCFDRAFYLGMRPQ